MSERVGKCMCWNPYPSVLVAYTDVEKRRRAIKTETPAYSKFTPTELLHRFRPVRGKLPKQLVDCAIVLDSMRRVYYEAWRFRSRHIGPYVAISAAWEATKEAYTEDLNLYHDEIMALYASECPDLAEAVKP